MNFVYKHTEEKRLIESLSRSQLISEKQLFEIKNLYYERVPYHNFLHALKVAEGVLRLPRDEYNIIETQSLFIAALFHDAWHTGTAEDLDEFRSLDMAFQWIIDFEKKYDYQWIDYSIVRKAIIGTVFRNRAKNTDSYAILLADLDISTLGMSLPEYLYFSDFPFSLECSIKIENWIHDLSFFKFITWVDKNIFRTKTIRKLYPEALGNIRKYSLLKEENIKKIYKYWEAKNVSYDDFETFFYENI